MSVPPAPPVTPQTPPPPPAVVRTALAPMQDLTTPAFMRLVAARGAPDFFVTEFVRVHATTRPEPELAEFLARNDTGRPVVVQLIGEDIAAMTRAAREFAALGAAGVDLNLGCPAPKVFRKNVGGGLLRDLPRVDALLAALRDALPATPLSVKTRTGFDHRTDPSDLFDRLLEIVARRGVDLLAVHARDVRGLYRSPVDYSFVARAVRAVPCPVFANGEISSAERAAGVVAATGCAGVMCGRHAVRNPWLFRQIRERFAAGGGGAVFTPTLADVRAYIGELAEVAGGSVGALKKFLNFVGTGVDAQGRFLAEMRRAPDLAQLLAVCDAHLVAGGRGAEPFSPEPYAGVVSRPNCEA
ncbi:MAG: tRNA-dihydrouridine synthase family protein [Puniceicoccales bacterium]|jgi:tRNA-dihydrouridine synthase|nr:tRNA-dihydrouridine synthase family protein [Puniceicoccales bacterium]